MHWRDLTVWQKANALVLATYRITRSFPEEEKFRLTNQLCRASASVPANIVGLQGMPAQRADRGIRALRVPPYSCFSPITPLPPYPGSCPPSYRSVTPEDSLCVSS